MQTHPNIDKKAFTSNSVIALKSSDKSYPLNTETAVLKWRVQGSDESSIPLTSAQHCSRVDNIDSFVSVNCWPTANGSSSDVNIDFELQDQSLELHDVRIRIPLPTNSGNPTIGSVDGSYKYDRFSPLFQNIQLHSHCMSSKKSTLEWQVALIDSSNKEGSLEFTVNGNRADDFFPVEVSFTSPRTYAAVEVCLVTTRSRIKNHEHHRWCLPCLRVALRCRTRQTSSSRPISTLSFRCDKQ